MCKADSDASGRAALNGGNKRQRVAIIGAGAAGMAAAWSLSRFPSKFEARATHYSLAHTSTQSSEACIHRWR